MIARRAEVTALRNRITRLELSSQHVLETLLRRHAVRAKRSRDPQALVAQANLLAGEQRAAAASRRSPSPVARDTAAAVSAPRLSGRKRRVREMYSPDFWDAARAPALTTYQRPIRFVKNRAIPLNADLLEYLQRLAARLGATVARPLVARYYEDAAVGVPVLVAVRAAITTVASQVASSAAVAAGAGGAIPRRTVGPPGAWRDSMNLFQWLAIVADASGSGDGASAHDLRPLPAKVAAAADSARAAARTAAGERAAATAPSRAAPFAVASAAAPAAVAATAFATDGIAAQLHAHAVRLHVPLSSAVVKALESADAASAGSAPDTASAPLRAALRAVVRAVEAVMFDGRALAPRAANGELRGSGKVLAWLRALAPREAAARAPPRSSLLRVLVGGAGRQPPPPSTAALEAAAGASAAAVDGAVAAGAGGGHAVVGSFVRLSPGPAPASCITRKFKKDVAVPADDGVSALRQHTARIGVPLPAQAAATLVAAESAAAGGSGDTAALRAAFRTALTEYVELLERTECGGHAVAPRCGHGHSSLNNSSRLLNWLARFVHPGALPRDVASALHDLRDVAAHVRIDVPPKAATALAAAQASGYDVVDACRNALKALVLRVEADGFRGRGVAPRNGALLREGETLLAWLRGLRRVEGGSGAIRFVADGACESTDDGDDTSTDAQEGSNGADAAVGGAAHGARRPPPPMHRAVPPTDTRSPVRAAGGDTTAVLATTRRGVAELRAQAARLRVEIPAATIDALEVAEAAGDATALAAAFGDAVTCLLQSLAPAALSLVSGGGNGGCGSEALGGAGSSL